MENSLVTIFVTGLFAGGLTCLAVQGGLLAATLSQQEEFKIKNGNALPILSFLIAKLAAYTLLGFLLGWLGSLVQLSLQVHIVLQLAVVIFMLGTALNLLNVHPLFRYFVIQPPRFLTRLIRRQSKSRGIFAPALLGALTIFIPCGTTQAMMALAIASGNPWYASAILFTFIVGTSPIFFLLGYVTMKLGDILQQHFMRVAAWIIILLALFNLEATLVLTGSQFTMRTMLSEGFCLVSYCNDIAIPNSPVVDQTITITANGYTPNTFVVKAGSTVTLHLTNKGAFGCTQAFTIPALNIQKFIQPNTSGDLVFVAPSTPGKLTFACSMGMYPGVIEVL